MKKIKLFDINSKDLIFPINKDQESEEKVSLKMWQLKELKIQDLRKIEIPIEDYPVVFYSGIMPESLEKEMNEDDFCSKILHLKDKNNNVRIRISLSGIMPTFTIFTRYYPQMEIDTEDLIPIVVDTSKTDEENVYGLYIIWKGNKKDSLDKAKEWLNTEYPNWKNPNAYWDD